MRLPDIGLIYNGSETGDHVFDVVGYTGPHARSKVAASLWQLEPARFSTGDENVM